VLLTTFVLGVMPLSTAVAEPLTECPRIVGDDCLLTLDDWKRVLTTNAALKNQTRLLAIEESRSGLLMQQHSALQESLKVMADSQNILITRVGKLTTDLIAKDKKYQNERVKPRLGNPLAWTITAAAVALATGFVAREALD
jgi:hypothetical protein